MSKFFFGAGMSIYQLSNSNSSEPVMPFVDDQQCVAKQLNRTGQLNSTFEVSESILTFSICGFVAKTKSVIKLSVNDNNIFFFDDNNIFSMITIFSTKL